MMDGKPSLGDFLRGEREKKGITLEQVASATKISMRHLQSLEADRYIDLPAKPFIRGFVNSYARFIGLDSGEVLTQFSEFIESHSKDRPTREEGHSGYAFEKREGDQSRTILWFVMGGFVVCGAIVFVFLKPSLKHHRPSHVDRLKAAHAVDVAPSSLPSPIASVAPKVEEVVPSPAPVIVVTATPTEKAAEKVEKKEKTEKVEKAEKDKDPLNSGADLLQADVKQKAVFRALEDVWVRFQVDSKKSMRFILRKDRVLVLKGKEGIRFQASDPKKVRYNYNNGGNKVLAEEKKALVRQGDLTITFPMQDIEKIQEPFPGSKVILGAAVPASPTPKVSPSPTP